MTQIHELQHVAHELLYLGADGSPIYADSFRQLNTEVLQKSDALFALKGENPEEEARLCLALLMGYNATIYDYGDKESKKQVILDRSLLVLESLPSSLLKCQLLTYCYGEVFEEELAKEAHAIIDGWKDRELLEEEKEIVENLRALEEPPYLFSNKSC
ncbi:MULTISPECIES: UpxZ family transcription anti-terminator antagonist [Bacteroides]|uniref:UpxZ family transcription anti-terminator antagonist n=1 Tax=Bacteroides TaxID=816 RepID=UPI0020303FF0|nr:MULTISPECIES: UpxZ family transcription anti-terminator antagonist [Bacteroides]MDV6186198.1 UpxZ family transcription anti-terminator antagonist [Bacteroides hominis (ex Liu et al. 2022)]